MSTTDKNWERPKNKDGKVWKGENMDIYSKRGDKVVFHGAFLAQVNWGGNDDPNTVLEVGETYEIDYTEIHSSHTKVTLIGIRGEFPSGAFHSEGAKGEWKEEK
jgi:hypothetical protein